jgi:AcrR family transcriptional regulator
MKEDLRVKKTKSALRKAFSNLLKTKSFDKITIMEICETAMVNRVTFYSHYKDKQSLFMDYVHFVTNKIIEKCYLVAKPYEGAQRAIIFFNELFKELVECLSHSDEEQYLNTIEDKSKPLRIQGITGQDENSRNEYIYFYQAEILGNWKKDDKPILVLQ